METALRVAACVLFGAAGLTQLGTTRGRPRRIIPAFMLLSFCVALTLTIDGPYLALDRLSRVANVSELVAHLAGVFGIGLLTYLLSDVQGSTPKHQGFRWLALGLTVSISIALFVVSDVPREAPRFTSTYGSQLSVALFWAVAAIYALGCLTRLALTVARSTPAGTRRDVVHGMRLAAVGGGALGAAYISLKTIELLKIAGSRAVGEGLRSMEQVVLLAGMLCLALGLGLPLAGRTAFDARRHIQIRVQLVRLRSARALMFEYGLVEDLGLPLSSNAPVRTDLVGPDAHPRLVRRVVEIRDGLLTLGIALPADDDASGSKDDRRRLDVVREAKRLASIDPLTIGSSRTGVR